MGAALDRDTIEKAYARWAPVYDIVFGAVFERGPHRPPGLLIAHDLIRKPVPTFRDHAPTPLWQSRPPRG